MHGDKQSKNSFVNMILNDFVVLANLTAGFALDEPDNRCDLARVHAQYSLLIGTKALTLPSSTECGGKTK